MSLCGACTIHFDGVAVRSCTMPVSAAKGKITTIEGISAKIDHPVQKAWMNTRYHNVVIANRTNYVYCCIAQAKSKTNRRTN